MDEERLAEEDAGNDRVCGRLAAVMLFSSEGGEKLCERAGVSAEEYRAAAVSGALEALGVEAKKLAAAEAPLVWRALLDAAEGGNMTAIKLYFDIFGRGAAENGGGEGVIREDGEVADLRSELFGDPNGGEGRNARYTYLTQSTENT